MPGGGLFPGDWDRLRDSARRVVGRFPGEYLAFVEIGIDYGGTARDMIAEIEGAMGSRSFVYYGIDLLPCPPLPPPQYPHIVLPNPPYWHIQRPSHKVIDWVSKSIHWVFVDADHSAASVMRDAILYGNRLAVGGEMCFHDAAPAAQGRDAVHVRKALDTGFLQDLGFEMILPSQDQERGGVEIYRKA